MFVFPEKKSPRLVDASRLGHRPATVLCDPRPKRGLGESGGGVQTRGDPNSTNRRLTQESLSVAVPEQRTLVCPPPHLLMTAVEGERVAVGVGLESDTQSPLCESEWWQ